MGDVLVINGGRRGPVALLVLLALLALLALLVRGLIPRFLCW